ncbi:MAG: hypothetical protein ACR2KX_15845 [Chitinophagaceae bacterium]
MKKVFPTVILTCIVILLLHPFYSHAQKKPDSLPTNRQSTPMERDGQYDFDFEIGTWKTTLKRLQNPLSGSTTWMEYTGTTVVKKVWNGIANLVELNVNGLSGQIKALSLRLYDPKSNQWSLNFANVNGGGIAIPSVGSFKNGRGEFYNQETFNRRAIFVRFVISDITPNSCHFEQAFSDDGGKTWEVIWIADDVRIREK